MSMIDPSRFLNRCRKRSDFPHDRDKLAVEIATAVAAEPPDFQAVINRYCYGGAIAFQYLEDFRGLAEYIISLAPEDFSSYDSSGEVDEFGDMTDEAYIEQLAKASMVFKDRLDELSREYTGT